MLDGSSAVDGGSAFFNPMLPQWKRMSVCDVVGHLAFQYTAKEHPTGTPSAPLHNTEYHFMAPMFSEFFLFALSLVCLRSPGSPSSLVLVLLLDLLVLSW